MDPHIEKHSDDTFYLANRLAQGMGNHFKNFNAIMRGSDLIGATKNGMKIICHLAKQKLKVYLGLKMNQIVLSDLFVTRLCPILQIDSFIRF